MLAASLKNKNKDASKTSVSINEPLIAKYSPKERNITTIGSRK